METFPDMLKAIENKNYMLKIRIMRGNIEKTCMMYKVIDIYERTHVVESQTIEESMNEVRHSNLRSSDYNKNVLILYVN